jgi:DivIVA domain-containing protein
MTRGPGVGAARVARTEETVLIVFAVVAAVVVFAVAAAAIGHGDGLEEPFPDMERPYLPDGRVEAVDIDDVHFAVAFRGYRMDQVDAVLDRLSEELVKRDQHIAALERSIQAQALASGQALPTRTPPPRPPDQPPLPNDHAG